MRTNEYQQYLESQQLNSRTIKSYEQSTHYLFEWAERERLEVEALTYNDLLQFIKYLQNKGVTQRTIQSYFRGIRHYFDYLESISAIGSNPVLSVEIKGIIRHKLYHILAPHELHQLYHQYPDQTHQGGQALRDRRNQIMLGLLVYQGLRTEELGRMTVQEVKLRDGEIDIVGSRKTNGRELQLESHQVMDMYDYVLKIRPELLKMNPKRKSQQRRETDLLFIGEGGQCYSISNFVTQMMIKVRQINASVQNAKQIRASVITKWVKQYNLRKAQYLAGHRYISTTESYLKNDLEGLQEELNQFHPF